MFPLTVVFPLTVNPVAVIAPVVSDPAVINPEAVNVAVVVDVPTCSAPITLKLFADPGPLIIAPLLDIIEPTVTTPVIVTPALYVLAIGNTHCEVLMY
jgi:hypothetical protein